MCGIAGIYLKNKKAGTDEGVSEFANALLKEIEPRGRNATGFVAVAWDRTTVLDKSDCDATEFVKKREPFPKGVQSVLLHTRWRTQGDEKVMGNNHPVIYNTCFAVHNGHISNDDKLFEDEKLKRNFEVDSEAIPAILDKHGLDHPDKIKEALEKLQGALAIAAIDPIRNPSRLVLAKGDSSPLYVFENKNVILWASTHTAIKDVWGNLIGTPPRGDKIKYTPEGTFLIADDYGDLASYKFTPKKKPIPKWDSSNYRRPTGGFRGNSAAKDQPAKPWDMNGTFVTQQAFLTACSDYRKTAANPARHWGARSSYDNDTDFQDVKGILSWFNCICGRSILAEDMVTHMKYGKICNDCAHVIADKYQQTANAAAQDEKEKRELKGKNSPLEGIDIPTLSSEDRRNFENWAYTEARIHRYALTDLSELTGWSTFALDFLLFRTGTTGADFGAKMLSVKYALKRAYNIVEAAVNEHYSKEVIETADFERKITLQDAQEIAAGMFYPWTAMEETVKGTNEKHIKYVCEDHAEEFFFGEHCIGCQGDDEEVDYAAEARELLPSEDKWPGEDGCEDIGGDSSCGVEVWANDVRLGDTDLVKCDACGGWYIGSCTHCALAAEKDKGDTKELPQAEVKKCCARAGSGGRKCRKKLALVVTNSVVGKRLGYCRSHWDTCSKNLCEDEAHFTGLTGERFCHRHSRGTQGVADSSANFGGNSLVIEEVK